MKLMTFRLFFVVAMVCYFTIACSDSSDTNNSGDSDDPSETGESMENSDSSESSDSSENNDSPEPGALIFGNFSFTDTEVKPTLDNTNKTVDATVSYAKDVSSLVAEFSVGTDITVTVDGKEQKSGDTPNNFFKKVTYKLTNKQEESVSYIVTITHQDLQNNSEHNAMLGNLGATTDIGPLKDPDGQVLVDDYNPLGKKVSSLFRISEIYATGVTIDDKDELLFDDQKKGFAQMLDKEADTAWSKSATKSIAGDFDGDGFEEVAVVIVSELESIGRISLRIIEDESDGYKRTTRDVYSMGEDISGLFNKTENYYWCLDIAAGDLDADGKSEILITVAHTLIVLDDMGEEFKVIDNHYYDGAKEDQYLRVATGDLDADGKDEFVVANGEWKEGSIAKYYIYDESIKKIVDEGDIGAQVNGKYRGLKVADVQIGDLDGDHLPEIAFCGNHEEKTGSNPTTVKGYFGVLIMDDSKQTIPYKFMNVYNYNGNEHNWRLGATGIGDLDGDGKQELIFNQDVYFLGNDDLSTPYGKKCLPSMHNDILTIGDVTGNHRDDVIFMKKDWKEGIYVYGINSSHDFAELAKFGKPSDGGYTTLTSVNSDSDSAVVEYLDKELLFTDPNIIAALSCPPYHEGIGQNITDIGTSFGLAQGTEVVKEKSFGFMVGVSFGMKWESPFGLASASVKTTIESSFDWTSSNSIEIETSVSYNSGPGEDKIIFSTIPFDVYYYKVLSSPESDQIGKTITINVPRKPQILSVDREFYNDLNGKLTDVTAQVMGHQIGDVSSYPSVDQKDELIKDGGMESELVTVGAGEGSVTVGISRTEGEGKGEAFDLNVTVETEFEAGKVTIGTSAGFHYGYNYQVTNTKSTFFEGQVGDIPSDKYKSELMYQFGLFAYNRKYEDQEFCMVDYWVE